MSMSSQGAAAIDVLLLFSSGEIGGAERSLTRMVLANRDAGISYRCATVGGAGEWSRWAIESGLDVFAYEISGAGIRGLLGAMKLAARLVAHRPQVIYVIGLRASIIVRLMKPILLRVRIVHGIRTTFTPGWVLTRRFAVVERLLGFVTSGYIANSQVGAESFRRISGVPADRIAVIPNGMPVAGPVPHASKNHRVVVVANIMPLKGHREFLEVVDLVRRRVPEVVFDFVGRDDMRGEIQSEAAGAGLDPWVMFHGFQSDLAPFLSGASVFALPSRVTEGAPTSILEAMAYGVPVVAYDVGGVSQMVDHCDDGFVIEIDDRKSMAESIEFLLRNPDVASRMGEHGRYKVEHEFSVGTCADRHAAVWRQLLA
jgi:glycosyltransferase involved in cell wall biosynthesis